MVKRLAQNGERGIRTPGTLLTHTRFPGVRLKPSRPSLQIFTTQYIIVIIHLKVNNNLYK